MEAGSDINDRVDDNYTALWFAAESGHEAVVRMLIKAGARVNDALTPLHVAAAKGHLAVVRALIELGADINKCGYHDRGTPLFHAAENGHEAAVWR